MTSTPSVGDHLREWRQRRRLSQLDLACEAEISTRHLSFLETGRSRPSREMVLRLAEHLDIPLRDRNRLLNAAGFAALYPERPLEALSGAREIVDLVLAAHEPNPALAIDRHWTLVAANRAVAPLMAGVDASLTAGAINVLRLSLHPGGLAPRTVNLGEWRAHILERLRRQVEVSADPLLADLLEELKSYPAPESSHQPREPLAVAIPFRLSTPAGVLSFLSTTTVFGTPVDVTLSELAIESFFPADAATAAVLRSLGAS